MKRGILLEEKMARRRNTVGRRLFNRLLRGGSEGPYWVHRANPTTLQILAPTMTITRLPQRRTMELMGSDGQTPVTSSFGKLYEGTTAEGNHVVVKIPKDLRQHDQQIKWAKEISVTQKFGAAGVGPRVLLSSRNPRRPFMIMEKFGNDLLEHLMDVLDQGDKIPEERRGAFLKGEGVRIRKAVDKLIGNIANLDHPTTCFGDFRFENIVIEDKRALQIDFDFCYPVPENVDVRTLLRLAASFSQSVSNTQALVDVFPPAGRLFGNELWKQRKQVLAQLQRISGDMRPEYFRILTNKMFDRKVPAHLFVTTLQRYYGADTQQEGETMLRTGRISPASIMENPR